MRRPFGNCMLWNMTVHLLCLKTWCLSCYNSFNLCKEVAVQYGNEKSVASDVCSLTKTFSLVPTLLFLFGCHNKMSIVSILYCLLELPTLSMITQEQNWSFLSDVKCRLQFA